MLTLLREHAQSWIIKVLLGAIILTFVISFGVGQFTSTKEVLVKVGSVEILVSEYNKRYQRELEQLRGRFPENADQLATQLNLRRQVFDQMVERTLLIQAAAGEELTVSNEEVSDAVHALDAFKIEGKFDYSTYRSILAQNRLTPDGYESAVREDLLVGKYRRNMLAGLVVSRDEVEQRYRVENEKIEVEYFAVEPAKFQSQMKSDPDAEKAYYEKNKPNYMEPRRIRVKFFSLSLDALKDKSKVRERAVTRYYERNKDTEFSTPKKVRARHILKKIPQDASEEERTKAKTLLAELRNRADKGEDFAALARKHSDDTSKSKGGDLGFFDDEQMLPEFSDVAFALNKGGLSQVVQTSFGFHLIQVTDVQPEVVEPFEAVREQIETKLIAMRAERSLEVEAGRLPARIQKEGARAVAESFGAKIRESDWSDGTGRIDGLGAATQLYNQLRGAKKDATGVLRRNPVQGHVFYQVSETKDAAQKSLDQVRAQVAAKVVEEKAALAAVSAAKEGIKSISSYKAFQDFRGKHGSPAKTVAFSAVARVIPDLGANKNFQQAAFRATPKKPFGLAINNGQAHILYLKKRAITEPGKADEDKKSIATQLEEQWEQYFFRAEIARLKDVIQVEIMAPEYVRSL